MARAVKLGMGGIGISKEEEGRKGRLGGGGGAKGRRTGG